MDRVLTVLFVDDEQDILDALKRGLINEEYKCFFAGSGQEALELMEKIQIGVIVSDMKMPNMDGLTLLKKVREKYPKTVRIMLSGYAQLQQVLDTVNQADIYGFITKPWKLDEELKVTIKKALDYYKLQVEREELEKALKAQNQAYLNMVKRFDEMANTARQNAEMHGNISINACEKILAGMDEKTNPSIIQKKLETMTEVLKALVKSGAGESSEKSSKELASSINTYMTNVKAITRYDINNMLEEHRTIKVNVTILKALISCTMDLLCGNTEKNTVKVSIQEEKHDVNTYCSISILISNLTGVNTAYLKDEYDKNADLVIEMLNIIVDNAMKYLNGSYTCARVDINTVQKFNIAF